MALPKGEMTPEEEQEFLRKAFSPVPSGPSAASASSVEEQKWLANAFRPITPESAPGAAIADQGRPTAFGPNVPYDPATTRGLNADQKRTYLQQFAQTDDIGLSGLSEHTLDAAYNYTRMLERDGYKPEYSSAHRPHGDPKSAHYSGLAIDQPYLRRLDGKPLTKDQEVALSRKYAKLAGFVTFGDEINYPTAHASGEHIHLSMNENGLGAKGFERLNPTKGNKPKFDKKTVVANIAQAVGIDRPDLLVRQFQLESGFNPDAISPAGALGIAQMMPDTLAEVAKKHGFTVEEYMRNPTLQVRAGALHMKDLLETHGNYPQALAAYNAGSGGLANAVKTGKIPEETLNYVSNILLVPRDQARSLITGGGAFVYNKSVARAQADADSNAYITAIKDFVYSPAGDQAKTIIEAAKRVPRESLEFGKEIAHGLSFGLSQAIPFLETGKYEPFKNLRANANVYERAAMGIPWMVGTIASGELLAAGFGATNVMRFASGSRVAGSMSPGLAKGAYGSLESFVAQFPQASTSWMGRMIMRGEEAFANTVAQTSAFAMQGGITAAFEAMRDPQKSGADVVIDTLSGAISSAGFGLLVMGGIPLVFTGGVTALNSAPKLGRALNPLQSVSPSVRAAAEKFGASSALGGAAVGFGGQMASNSITGEEGGKLESAAVGAAAGALGAVGLRQLPPVFQEKVRSAVASFWNGLDATQKRLWTAGVMEGVTQAAAAGTAISREVERQAVARTLAESSETFANHINNHKALVQSLRANEQSLQQAVTIAQNNLDLARAGIGEDKIAAFDSLLQTQKTAADSVADFIKNNPPNPQTGKRPQNQIEALKELQSRYKSAEKAVTEAAKDEGTAYYWRLSQVINQRSTELDNFRASPQFANIGYMDSFIAQNEYFLNQIDELNAGIRNGDLDITTLPKFDGPWEGSFSSLDPFDRNSAEAIYESMQRWHMEVAQKGYGKADDLLNYSQAYFRSLMDPNGSYRIALQDTIDSLKNQINKTKTPQPPSASRAPGKRAATSTVLDFDSPNVFNVTYGVPTNAVREAQRRGSPLFWNVEEFGRADSQTAKAKKEFWRGKTREDRTVWVDAQTYLNAVERQGALLPSADGSLRVQYGRIKNQARKGTPVGYSELNLRGDGSIHVFGGDVSLFPASSQALAKVIMELGGGLMPIRVNSASVDPLGKIIRGERKLRIQDRIEGLESLLAKAEASAEANKGGIQQAASTLAEGRDPLNLSSTGVAQSIVMRDARRLLETDALSGNTIKKWDEAFGEAQALWVARSPEEKARLMEAEVHDLLTLFENKTTPSAYKRAIELEGAVTDERIAESTQMLETLLGNDRDTSYALKEVIDYMRSTNPTGMDWRQDAFGMTQQMAETNLYNIRKAALAVSSKLSDNARLAFEDVVNLRKLDAEGASKLNDELVFALEDPGKRLSAFLKEGQNADLRPLVAGLLEMQGALERFAAWSPQLKAYTRAHYLHHSHPNIAAFSKASDNQDAVTVSIKLATEKLRSFGTLAEKKNFTDSAYDFLTKDLGLTERRWFAMTEEARRAEVQKLVEAGPSSTPGVYSGKDFGYLPDAASINQRQQDITSGLLLRNPIDNPWDMIAAQATSVLEAVGSRRFMSTLPQFLIDTGVPGVAPSPLLLVVDEGVDLANLPRVANRYQGRGKMGEESRYTRYIPIDQIESMRGLSIIGEDGKDIPSSRLAISPDAADFMQRYWSASRLHVAGESMGRVNSVLNDTALRGSPLTHIWNMTTQMMGEFALAPIRGLGIPAVGKALFDSQNGQQLLLNAVQHGVNIRTLNQSARMYAQSALSMMDEKQIAATVGNMSTGQKMMEALDPASPAHAAAMKEIEKMPLWKQAAIKTIGFIPKVDQLINRATLFDIIEKMQLGMFYYKAGDFYKRFELDPAMANMPKNILWRDAQRAAAEYTNRVTGAGHYYYHTNTARQAWEVTTLTPSWWRAKADLFMAALEGSGFLGLAGGAGENIGKFGSPKLKRSMFAHYSPPVRKQMAEQLRNYFATIFIGSMVGTQLVSIGLNGRTTYENGKENAFHIQMGDSLISMPLGGLVKNIVRGLGAITDGDVSGMLREASTLFAPNVTTPVALMQNMDPFTRQPIYRPGGDMMGQMGDVAKYAVSQYMNTEEILGVKRGADALGLMGLSADGSKPVMRLNDRQWMLKLLGMHEKRFDRPRVEEAKFKLKISYYEREHTRHVRELLTAAANTPDLTKRQALEGQAYELALSAGKTDIKDKEVTQYLPDGILRMTPEEFLKIYEEINTPSEALVLDRNNDPKTLAPLLERLRQDRWLKLKSAADTFLHPGDGDT